MIIKITIIIKIENDLKRKKKFFSLLFTGDATIFWKILISENKSNENYEKNFFGNEAFFEPLHHGSESFDSIIQY